MLSGVGGLSNNTLLPLVLLVGWLPTVPARFQPDSATDSFRPSLGDDADHLFDERLVIVGGSLC